MEKDFTGWHTLKAEINAQPTPPLFQERDVWWCRIGVNIGHEEDGKNKEYSRPVLIIRKFNQHIFWGVPLTTQIKQNPYYYRIQLRERSQCVMLSQLRLWESKRLTDRMGKLPKEEFKNVKAALKMLL